MTDREIPDLTPSAEYLTIFRRAGVVIADDSEHPEQRLNKGLQLPGAYIKIPEANPVPEDTVEGLGFYGTSHGVPVMLLSRGPRLWIAAPAPTSPVRFRFELTLFDDSLTDVLGNGTVVLIDLRAESMHVIGPALAFDRQGRPVPVRWRRSGDSLLLDVDHRAHEHPVIAGW